MDNYAAHKHPASHPGLAGHNPRVSVHFTPAHVSWMNLAEVWFSSIGRQAFHSATFTSVPGLHRKIRAFVTGWNDHAPVHLDQNVRADPAKVNRKKTVWP